jgi:hypothetical protein
MIFRLFRVIRTFRELHSKKGRICADGQVKGIKGLGHRGCARHHSMSLPSRRRNRAWGVSPRKLRSGIVNLTSWKRF